MSSPQDQTGYTIGRLATAAGVNVETVRYYQRRGLLTEPEKPWRGFRQYPSSYVGQIQFIKRAQKLGFSLVEITELLELGSGHCRDVRKRAESKRNKIEQQINDLLGLRDTLEKLICACRDGGKDRRYCPMVDSLRDN